MPGRDAAGAGTDRPASGEMGPPRDGDARGGDGSSRAYSSFAGSVEVRVAGASSFINLRTPARGSEEDETAGAALSAEGGDFWLRAFWPRPAIFSEDCWLRSAIFSGDSQSWRLLPSSHASCSIAGLEVGVPEDGGIPARGIPEGDS